MDDPDKPDPATELNELSCWTLEPDSEDNDYFFGSDRESTILGEFGWNYSSSELEPTLEPGHFTCTDRVKADDEPSDMVAASSSSQLPANAAFQRLYSAAPAVVTAEASTTATSNPSVSSSSSEDLPEKSTVSGGGKPGETSTKVKKKGQKRIRQQRFAFMTKSEVDHLEDGYRWRKYGQKAVKNSPFPRSYYRCTNSKCTVKKRVERSSENPTVVITTYEGQHCHHTVGFPRGGFVNYEGAFGSQFTPPTLQNYYQGMQFNRESSVGVAQSQQVPDGEEKGSLSVDPPMAPGLPTDDGLLGDIVPHGMRNL